MSQPPRIVVWDDFSTSSTFVRLEVEDRFVQRYITREETESYVAGPQELFRVTLELLCEEWFKRFGTRVKAIAPEVEGEAWRIGSNNTIDGEVIEDGRRAIDASRKAIEGR